VTAADAPGAGAIALVSERASLLGLELPVGELADLALREGMGEPELEAVAKVLGHLSQAKHEAAIERLLRRSRLPLTEPKTFDGFDFERLQGDGTQQLAQLRTLANLYARSNLAFIGPSGVGKSHLAQAYGRECCLRGIGAYYLTASDLRDRLTRIAQKGGSNRSWSTLVSPPCLIVDEIGRCTFDTAQTNLFFELADRRYARECPNTMVLTSTRSANEWTAFFEGTDNLVKALDRIFDRASVFLIKGTSYRGRALRTFSVETIPQVSGPGRR